MPSFGTGLCIVLEGRLFLYYILLIYFRINTHSKNKLYVAMIAQIAYRSYGNNCFGERSFKATFDEAKKLLYWIPEVRSHS